MLQLRNGESEVTLCPEIGAAIARHTWHGHDILRRASDAAIADRLVRQMGVYPLMPYSNRIGHARLIAGDETFQLRPNFSQEPHAVHGFGWQRAWQIVDHGPTTATLFLTHEPDSDWPFRCESTQHVALTADALTITLAVKNTDTRTMPVGLGFHPYFPLNSGTRLQSEWRGMWQMDAESLPAAWVNVPAVADFRALRDVHGWKVDNCFTDWQRHAILDHGTHRVAIEASDACRNIVVYAPNDGRQFIALEPVTNINNAFALAAQGVANTGARMLAPGASFDVSMSITVTGNADA
jgi:aldose 1-epimerase